MAANERLAELLDYIEQVEKLKRKATFVVPDDFFRAFQGDMQGLPGLEFNQLATGDDVWLRVPRLKEIPPPDPDAKLAPWVSISKSPDKPPELREETSPGTKAEEPVQHLEDHPEVRKAFDWYRDELWEPWAAAERQRRKTIGFYNKLFSLQQAMATEGAETSLELVWGLGVCLWRRDGRGRTVRHPLITQTCEISIDETSFVLEVRPRDVDPVLELDCYAELEISGITQLEAFWKRELQDAENRMSPFEASTFERTLRAAVTHLDPSGSYMERQANPVLPEAADKLAVTDTWVIFARKRSEHVFLDDIRRLKKRLKDNQPIPAVLRAFVEEGDSSIRARPGVAFRGLSSSGAGPGVRELFFPMPYNDEQVSIVEKLETNDGVVVQGPPGTGKTHTIANVICHFLAQGKRVLVTSKGESALAVLQEKLPEEVRHLSVALLSDEREGMKQFEHAIQSIATGVAALNQRSTEVEIVSLEERLGNLHQQIAAIDGRVAGFANKHMKNLRFRGRDASPEELARYVLDAEAEHKWLDDALSSEAGTKLEVSDADIGAIRSARIALGADLQYLDCTLPGADAFPNEHLLLALHKDILRAKEIEERAESGQIFALVDSTQQAYERAKGLYSFVEQMDDLLKEVDGANLEWASELRREFRKPERKTLIESLLQVAGDVLSTENVRQQANARPAAMPDDVELDKDFNAALARLTKGKGAFALPFGSRETREKLAQTKVAGLDPQGAGDWSVVEEAVSFRLTARQLIARWNALASDCQLPSVEGLPNEAFRRLVAFQEQVSRVRRLAIDFDAEIEAQVQQVFGNGVLKQLQGHESPLEALKVSLAEHLDRGRLHYAMAQITDVLSKLDGKSGPVVEKMRSFLREQVGSGTSEPVALQKAWSGFLSELRRLAGQRPYLETVLRVTALVEASGAVKWARRLQTLPAPAETDSETPANWIEAWNWRCAKTFLETIDGHQEIKKLFDKRRVAEAELARVYRDLVSRKTWLGVFLNSPDSIRQALQRYLNSIQSIGAGRGIRAVRHRRNARDAMQRAYKAVPCWVMPHWRVSETIPPEIGLFDLVVVDEASQSDIWALPALMRGSKLLIVGDHKQVSPAAVGMAEQNILQLSARFLRVQPHGSEMTPDKSIYDLARVVFAGNSLMLKEHFRCVSPIIEFSNRTFYEGEIRPLRTPRRSERLDPPLVDVIVRGGYRKGDVNEPEARAIVAEVEAILADPLFAGRTIGVVTLMGNAQAPFIDKLLREHIQPKDFIERKISVGAPPAFQGRERDIMLMSMVLQPGDHGASNQSQIEQRFNVAASRARDRMILFRSIEEGSVNPASLTAKLISHFRHPFIHNQTQVAALRELCESGFERDMFDVLTERGYRVRPQVRVSHYRIDFVVEGSEDRRLAIECDGDRFHGPGQWQEDMNRQRVLERAGWTFWRCFASSFVMRRREVVDDLVATLTQLGIEPIGSETVDSGAWVTQRIIDPLEENAAEAE